MNIVKVLKEHTPRHTADRFREWVEIDFDNPHAVSAAKREEALGFCKYLDVTWPEESEKEIVSSDNVSQSVTGSVKNKK